MLTRTERRRFRQGIIGVTIILAATVASIQWQIDHPDVTTPADITMAPCSMPATTPNIMAHVCVTTTGQIVSR
jgi:hypothetical protein